MSEPIENFDIDSLLDATLDDVADLPTFEPFVAGVHSVSMTMGQVVINESPCIEVNFVLKDTLELAEPTKDTKQEPGSKANTVCFMDNEMGQGTFKMFAAAIVAGLGLDPTAPGVNRQALTECKDLDAVIITSIRVDKKSNRSYLQVKEVILG